MTLGNNQNHWGSLGRNCEWPDVSSFANGGWGAKASCGHVNQVRSYPRLKLSCWPKNLFTSVSRVSIQRKSVGMVGGKIILGRFCLGSNPCYMLCPTSDPHGLSKHVTERAWLFDVKQCLFPCCPSILCNTTDQFWISSWWFIQKCTWMSWICI